MAKQIFVLDDEEDMTLLTKSVLVLNGLSVVVSNDPEEALETLEKNHFDLIFVDLMMPGISGFHIVSAIREKEKYKNTPIIVLSAKRLTNDERKFVLSSQARFIRKPIAPTQMVEVVRDELKSFS